MNRQFDLVVSETRSAALRALSLVGRCQNLTDGKRYLDPPAVPGVAVSFHLFGGMRHSPSARLNSVYSACRNSTGRTMTSGASFSTYPVTASWPALS